MILLSVLIPVSMLATFRLVGIIPEPLTPQTITVDAVSWNMSRPSSYEDIRIWVNSSFSDESASIWLKVHVEDYTENKLGWPSDGDDDVLQLKLVSTANVKDGFVNFMIVNFSLDSISHVTMSMHSTSMELRNLEIKKFLGRFSTSFETKAVNKPQDTLFSITTYSVFSDPNNTSHWTTITLEAVFFAGGAYKKVKIPLQLGVLV